jgi:hypothetical protein
MSNHLHLVLRSRPDVVQTWDDNEIASRWLRICPKRKDSNGKPLEPTQKEIDLFATSPVAVKRIRSRLSDISWWMRILCQRIAMRANHEDKEVGKFFRDGSKLYDFSMKKPYSLALPMWISIRSEPRWQNRSKPAISLLGN